MLRRILSLLLLAWLFAFMWFAIVLPQPLADQKTDAAIVFTGGDGRVDRGLETLRKGWAKQLLISGVDREVRPEEFAAEYRVSKSMMKCCVTLGYESYDTRSNAIEASQWMAAHKFRSGRLITTDWHMRRAAFELQRAEAGDLTILRDAVPSQPRLRILFLEFHKLIARYLSQLWGA